MADKNWIQKADLKKGAFTAKAKKSRIWNANICK